MQFYTSSLRRAIQSVFYLRNAELIIGKAAGSYTASEERRHDDVENAESEGFLPHHVEKGPNRPPKLLLVSRPAFIAFITFGIILGGLGTVLFRYIYNLPSTQAVVHHHDHHHEESSPAPVMSTDITASNSKVMVKPCGSTPEEARARGCHFDVISFCWLPDRCYDPELSAEFDKKYQLEWFVDPERTQPLSHEQVMTGDYTGLYVNWEYHLSHCTAMWKKLHRAIAGPFGKGAIDSYIGPYTHTQHCEHMLLGNRSVAFDVVNTIILVKYPDCGIE
jgi:hypothetical protein